MIRTYSELRQLQTFDERFEYLRLAAKIGDQTFGFHRYLNQRLYTSKRWLKSRDDVIIRDHGCDLGIKGRDILGIITVHHMNPATIEDVEFEREELFDPMFLISTSALTHKAITLGNKDLLPQLPIERRPNDMCPWR